MLTPDSPRRLLLQPPEARSRRSFLRSAAGFGIATLGTGLLMTDEAWAASTARAATYGITPGTVVDAQGRPMAPGGSDPFLGEIVPFACNFAPRGHVFCNGQLLPIAQNTALFSLLGTIYGGNGETDFAVPDLRGRMPMHFGPGPGLSPRGQGQRFGSETVTLTAAQLPSHSHEKAASADVGTMDDPTNAVPAVPASSIPAYADSGTAALDPTGNAGGGQAHDNMSPFRTINFCIATVGTYPS